MPDLLGDRHENELHRGVPSAVSANLANETIEFTHDELRERLSGNLCRCGAYIGIVDAVATTFAKRTT